MNDAEFAAQRARIEPLIERWVKPLGLNWWRLEFVYVRDEFEVDGKPAPSTMASCRANWRYLNATIEWNMPRVLNEDDDATIERAFVHELTHVLINEMREHDDDWLDHEERVASTLTMAFIWLRESLTGDDPQPESTLSVEHHNGQIQPATPVPEEEVCGPAVDREERQGLRQGQRHPRGQQEGQRAGS